MFVLVSSSVSHKTTKVLDETVVAPVFVLEKHQVDVLRPDLLRAVEWYNPIRFLIGKDVDGNVIVSLDFLNILYWCGKVNTCHVQFMFIRLVVSHTLWVLVPCRM